MAKLFTPVVDVDHRVYCGPHSIAVLTGVPVSRIENMFRRRRRGYRDATGRKLPIKGVSVSETLKVLRLLGCKVTDVSKPEATFGRFCADTAHIDATYLVNVTGHFAVVHKGVAASAFDQKRKARRVLQVWRVNAPAEPKYDTAGPAPRPKKPKPPVQQVRYDRVLAKIKSWETKAKRARNALKKLERQRVYYEKNLAV
jgi:hypothetical protein